MADNKIARVHQPAFLQTVSLGFEAPGLIADQVAPRIPVKKQSDLYRVFGKNTLLDRSAATEWHPGTTPNAIEFTWSSDNYYAKIHKLRQILLDAETANADSDLDLSAQYTENVTRSIAIAREVRVSVLFTTAANYSGSHVVTKAGGQEWNTVATNVLIDLQAAIQKVKQDALVSASELSIVIPDPVFDQAIKFNSDIIAKIQYVQRGVIDGQLLASLLGVKEVIIATTQTAGSAPESEGQDVLTGYTTSYLWGDSVWVGVIKPGQNQNVATFCRSFNWTAATGGAERRVRRYRAADEGQEGDWIEVTEAIGEKIVFKDAGYLIKNTSSTF